MRENTNTYLELIHVSAMENATGKGHLDVPGYSDVYNDIKLLYPLRDELVRRMGEKSATLVNLYVTNPVVTKEIEEYIKSVKGNEEIPDGARGLVRNLSKEIKTGKRVFPSEQHGGSGMGSRILDVLDVFGNLVENNGRNRYENGYYNDVFDYVSRTKAVEAALDKADRSGLRRLIRVGGPVIDVKPSQWFGGVKDVRVDSEKLETYRGITANLVDRMIAHFK